jgi:hypothetical protein
MAVIKRLLGEIDMHDVRRILNAPLGTADPQTAD